MNEIPPVSSGNWGYFCTFDLLCLNGTLRQIVPAVMEAPQCFDSAGCLAPMLKCELRPALTVPDVHRITTRAVFMLLLRAGRLDRQAHA